MNRVSLGRVVLVVLVLAVVATGAIRIVDTAFLGGGDPVIVAVGDIACDPGDDEFNGGRGTASECRHKHTSDLVANRNPAAFLALGDLQYEDATYEKFLRSYEPTWGRFKDITRPAPGNHEYRLASAPGYFEYFGRRAGEPGRGYYSFDLGGWHLIALNSNCDAVGGCGEGSPQLEWLRRDLAASSAACTLAFWHHPRFTSSAHHGDDPATGPFWDALYEEGADVVLVGHAHSYERFAPQDPDGRADSQRGLRQFVVGTGGRGFHEFGPADPNTETRNSDTYGVLELTLEDGSYDWKFRPEEGKTFTDEGSADCH